MRHEGKYPTLAQLQADWSVMTNRTRADGTIDNVAGMYGPYLKNPPLNSFEMSHTVAAIGGEGAGVGWIYNETSAAVTAVVVLAAAQNARLDTDPNVVTY